MVAPTLIEAHRRFAAAIDDLRRKCLSEFDVWLNAALAKGADNVRKDIMERVRLIRVGMAEAFVRSAAPAIIKELNPDAAQDIAQKLDTFAAHDPLPRSVDLGVARDDVWRPGLVRTMLGAGIGAIAGLFLLGQAPGAPGPVRVDQPASAAAPTAEVPSPQPPARPGAPVPLAAPSPHDVAQAALTGAERALAAALGAALGAFIMICPPLRLLMPRAGLAGGMLALLHKVGPGIFLLSPRVVLAAGGTLVTALVAIGGFLITLGKAGQLWLGLGAVAAIALARWTSPERDAGNLDSTRRMAIDALDRQLTADANVWSALAAGLVLQPPRREAGEDATIDRVRETILRRRAEHQPPDTILRIVEQLVGARAPARPEKEEEREPEVEFIWKRADAERFATYGVVEEGDVVIVTDSPLERTSPDGTSTVVRKGQVTRKR